MANTATLVADVEQVKGKLLSLTGQYNDLLRQVQTLQGYGGTLEPTAGISGWDETAPFISADATTGRFTTQPTTTYVGIGQSLLAGRNIIFERIDNTPFLRVSTIAGIMNVDYVVDSNGFGTHLTLFGSTGALAQAITDAADRAIWICTTHTETSSGITSLNGMVANQSIHIFSAGPQRPYIVRGHSGTMFTFSTNSGGVIRFEGINWGTSMGTGTQDLYQASNGVTTPDIEILNCGFGAAVNTSWDHLVNVDTGGGANSGNLLLKDIQDPKGTVDNIVKTTTGSSPDGWFWMEGCDFRDLETISDRTFSTDTDWGLGASNQIFGIWIINNRLSISSYAWKRSYNVPMYIVGNHIRSTGGSGTYVFEFGTSATTSPQDVTMSGNYVNVRTAGAHGVKVGSGAGTASNISIMGNAFAGPGSGTSNAVTLDVAAESATNGYSVVNSYRNWTNNVTGTGASGGFTGVDHGGLIGLADDDHTQYLRHDGTRALTANWSPGAFNIGNFDYTSQPTRINIDDTSFNLNMTTGTANQGNTSIGGTTAVEGDSNQSNATKITLPTGTVIALAVYGTFNLTNRVLEIALYTDSGGSPSTKVATTGQFTVAATGAAWREQAVLSNYAATAGTYWIAFQGATGFSIGWTYYYDTGAAGSSMENNSDTQSDLMESPWSGGSSGTRVISAYAVMSETVPTITFDTNDTITYKRITDTLAFNIASTAEMSLTSTGLSVADKMTVGNATLTTDDQFYMGTASATAPIVNFDSNDYLQYNRATNVFNFLIGGTTEVDISATGLVVYDQIVVGNATLTTDDQFLITPADATTPRINFDSGDLFQYDRTNNMFVWAIGGSAAAQLDGNGDFRTVGYARFGSLTAPANTTDGDVTMERLQLAGNTAFGAMAGLILAARGTMTNTAAGAVAPYFFNPTLAPASNSSSEFRTLYFQSLIAPSTGVTMGNIAGGYFENRDSSNAAITSLTGIISVGMMVDSSSPATVGAVTTVTSVEVRGWARPSGTSTATITDLIGINIGANWMGSSGGATITTAYGLRMTDPTVNTITTLIGIDLAKLTRATTNIEFRNAGKTVYTPTTQTLAAATNTIVNTGTIIFLDNSTAASLTLTSDPTIATTGAQNGQIIILVNVDSADDIVLRDDSVASSALRLPGAANLTLGPRDSAIFVYVSAATEWYCIATANL